MVRRRWKATETRRALETLIPLAESRLGGCRSWPKNFATCALITHPGTHVSRWKRTPTPRLVSTPTVLVLRWPRGRAFESTILKPGRSSRRRKVPTGGFPIRSAGNPTPSIPTQGLTSRLPIPRVRSYPMQGLTRFVHMLMLVVMASVAVVPGGLAMNVCLCDAATMARARATGSCGMPCCQAQHDDSAGQRITNMPHSGCTDCLALATGERDASTLVGPSVDVPQAAALITAPIVVVAPFPTHFCRFRPRAGSDLAPPGRCSPLPLRI